MQFIRQASVNSCLLFHQHLLGGTASSAPVFAASVMNVIASVTSFRGSDSSLSSQSVGLSAATWKSGFL